MRAVGRAGRFPSPCTQAAANHRNVGNVRFRYPPSSTSFRSSRCFIFGVSLNLARMFCSSIMMISSTGASRMVPLVTSFRLVNVVLRISGARGSRSNLNHPVTNDRGEKGLHPKSSCGTCLGLVQKLGEACYARGCTFRVRKNFPLTGRYTQYPRTRRVFCFSNNHSRDTYSIQIMEVVVFRAY